MIKLTAEQTKELKDDTPPRIVVEDKEYVLVQADVYEQVKGIIESTPEEIDPSLYEFDEIENP